MSTKNVLSSIVHKDNIEYYENKDLINLQKSSISMVDQ